MVPSIHCSVLTTGRTSRVSNHMARKSLLSALYNATEGMTVINNASHTKTAGQQELLVNTRGFSDAPTRHRLSKARMLHFRTRRLPHACYAAGGSMMANFPGGRLTPSVIRRVLPPPLLPHSRPSIPPLLDTCSM